MPGTLLVESAIRVFGSHAMVLALYDSKESLQSLDRANTAGAPAIHLTSDNSLAPEGTMGLTTSPNRVGELFKRLGEVVSACANATPATTLTSVAS